MVTSSLEIANCYFTGSAGRHGGRLSGCIFPPALPAIAGLVLFNGWHPFLFLLSMGVVKATFAAAGVAAAAALFFSAVVNLFSWVIQGLDNLINPPNQDKMPNLTEQDYSDFYGETTQTTYQQILQGLDFDLEPPEQDNSASCGCFGGGKDRLWGNGQPVNPEQEILHRPLTAPALQ